MEARPPSDRLDLAFARLREGARQEPDPPLAVRKDRLTRLRQMLERHAVEFEAAISADFGHRSVHETRLAESFIVEAALGHALRNVQRWMKPKRIATQMHFWPGVNRLIPQPLGVVGVIAPGNYPLQLSLAPAVGAIAAGNRVMIKPSELTARFSAALAKAISSYFSDTELAVVQGGPELGHRFSALPFDKLLFTGSAAAGRVVAETAGRNLTPVILELGGKSPAIIDASANVSIAARRIAYGKLLNAGQTCIAPDYVLCPADRREEFVRAYFAAVEKLYGSGPRNRDYTAILNPQQYERLELMLDDAIAKGARVEAEMGSAGRAEWKALGKFPPCVVLDVTDDMLVGQEEIFGPVLPVLTYDGLGDAIRRINAGERPLALYWFGEDVAHRERVLRETVSGGVTINDCLLHIAQEHQPFGGVGASGSGSYHGEWGFRAFSKEKPVFIRSKLSGSDLFLPPYRRRFDRMLALLRRLV